MSPKTAATWTASPSFISHFLQKNAREDEEGKYKNTNIK
jgi:hypothetical protein